MKKWFLSAALSILVILLMLTKSLYVEWGELSIIIGTLSLISIFYLRRKMNAAKLLLTSAGIGFIFCMLFGGADLMIDHYLYFLPNGTEDGTPLSLSFKIQEFKDDLVVGSIISMLIVLTVTLFTKKIFPYTFTKGV